MRWLIAVAVFLGVIAGLAFPTGSPASHAGLYSVWITPPTGLQFRQVPLSCGWHGVCESPWYTGPGLDWPPHASTQWSYFRGGFKRSGLSYATNNLLKKHVYFVDYGSNECDIVASDLWENLVGWPPRFGMHYYHVQAEGIIPWFEKIWVDGTVDGYFKSYVVSYPIDDTGCAGTGLHTHDEAVLGPPPNGLPGYNSRPEVPTASECHSGNCFLDGQSGPPHNWEWMRYFEWSGGHY